MAPHASPPIFTVLGPATATALRISLFDGSLTGPAGAGGMSANTSGKPNRLKNWRTSASSAGGLGSVSLSAVTMADRLISRLNASMGPFARLNVRNQIATNPAITDTTDPAAESTAPSAPRWVMAQILDPTSHPMASPRAARPTSTTRATPACDSGEG